MSKRKSHARVPSVPRRFNIKVGERIVAEIAFGDDPGQVVPGSLVWRCKKPEAITAVEREKSIGRLIREANLDPKTDHERLMDLVYGPPCPKPLKLQ